MLCSAACVSQVSARARASTREAVEAAQIAAACAVFVEGVVNVAAVVELQSCSSCRHSRPTLTDGDPEPILKCHRYPPTLFVLDDELTQAFPDANEPCGEWST